jgi:dTDP-4-amino-4,6-dideoxygalactose transaminase
MKVDFYRHNLGKEEKKMVMKCLDDIFLTTGSYVDTFEEDLSNYLHVKHSVGLTSCTAALHLSLLALGIGEGDEVITTPMTFIATANAIIFTGATPVLVDCHPDTALINEDLIEDAISERTKAIIPVHLYGQLCNMKKIRAIADKYNLKVIEDAAHSVEGERDGYKPGNIGDIVCFSFYATKNITSGEGGAIATNNEDLAKKIKLLRQHGVSKEVSKRYGGLYEHWDMVELGWKYNMSNIQAAMLIPQLKKIDQNWHRRDLLYKAYKSKIDNITGISYPRIEEGSKSAYHLFTIWVDPNKRDNVLKYLSTKGIGCAVNYRAIHLLTYYKKKYGYKVNDFPNAERIGNSTITLPFWIRLTDQHIEEVIARIEEAINHF